MGVNDASPPIGILHIHVTVSGYITNYKPLKTMSGNQMFILKVLREHVTPETILNALLFVFAAFIFVGSFEFARKAALFPQFVSVVLFVGLVLLFLRPILPSSLEPLISDSTTALGSSEFTMGDDEEGKDLLDEAEEAPIEEATTGEAVESDRPLDDRWFIVAGMVGYGLIGYLVGLLWATPIFVVIASKWYGLSLRRTLLIMTVLTAVAYLFTAILNIPIHRGLLIGGGV